MLYFLWGIILGIVLNFLPLWEPAVAVEIYPEWHGAINSISEIELSGNKSVSNIKLGPVKTPGAVSLLMGSGAVAAAVQTGDFLTAVSGSGEYLVKYEKVGNEIEFQNIYGERFWKIESKEYPYLSFHGKRILLLNGDQSRIRVADFNGNMVGEGEIEGRICTVISFSEYSDFAGIGFLDGGYYIIDAAGKAFVKDRMPTENIIKGIAINASGTYAAVHYGNNNGDSVRLLDFNGNSEYKIPLAGIHHAKTTLNVSEDGKVSLIDFNRIIVTDREGNIETVIKIPAAGCGTASMGYFNGLYSAAYRGEDGMTRLLVFRGDGTVLVNREFPGESFIELVSRGPVLLLKGSQNLYCYSFYYQAPE